MRGNAIKRSGTTKSRSQGNSFPLQWLGDADERHPGSPPELLRTAYKKRNEDSRDDGKIQLYPEKKQEPAQLLGGIAIHASTGPACHQLVLPSSYYEYANSRRGSLSLEGSQLQHRAATRNVDTISPDTLLLFSALQVLFSHTSRISTDCYLRNLRFLSALASSRLSTGVTE
ncbi:unnamed protein product [Rangifer tarandus platyrhynchus]|uniref:Uncharacterized protein n=1 Tax=Rangifer tarandus platyrhynchus TaxID=3082113 RepID=A0ABN8XJD4_RANTA|nr:unnamed protein product [Rangifer tarandus platyrhynchus]